MNQQHMDSLLFITPRPDIVMKRGQGMYLYDTDGNAYLDFIAGWAVNCLGHCPQALQHALQIQSQQLINASPSFYNAPMLAYAQKLTKAAAMDRVFFTSTGAEANESAIKLARKYGTLHKQGASEIITTHNSFHGRTLTTMAATGKKQWDTLFEPKSKGFVKADFNDITSITSKISAQTCAIMIEPVQGEGGVHVASQEFIAELRTLCDRENILLIFDEIQTGMGRTGKMFAFEHYVMQPDILTLAKGIGGGFPLSAMLCRERLNIFEPGEQGGTYCGQPLAMAAGIAVLDEIEKEAIVENCAQQSKFLLTQLQKLSADFEITHIRGMGLLLAFDLVHSNAVEVAQNCLKNGLLINALTPKSIRLMPPLIVTAQDSQNMLDILTQTLRRL